MARRFKKKSSKPKKDKSAGKIAHKKTEVDGIVFHSKMESEYYKYLKELKEKGTILKFELQPEYVLQDKFIVVDGEVIYGEDNRFDKLKRKTKATTVRAIKYIADFKVTYNDERVEVVDTKGKSTADFEIKRKMLLCKYPTIDFKVLILSNKEWVDYYQHNKELRAKKRKKKLESQKEE